jgi:hypothetical protein
MIKKNYHVKDEEVLRYIPYVGENKDIDLTEVYKFEVLTPKDKENLERMSFEVIDAGSKTYCRIVEEYLKMNDLTMEQVLQIIESPLKKATQIPSLLKQRIHLVMEIWEEKTFIPLKTVIHDMYVPGNMLT